MPRRPAVFLDKDGTLLVDVPYNVDPARMRFAPGAAQGLRLLADCGVPLIVVSNQPGVALGRFDADALGPMWRHLAAMCADAGAPLLAWYGCPHHPAGKVAAFAIRCDCRKPADGLPRRAAAEHGIDLARSWFVGDILNDVECGRRAGCRTVLIDNGNETEWVPGPLREPHHTVPDMLAAARIVAGALRGAPSYPVEHAP